MKTLPLYLVSIVKPNINLGPSGVSITFPGKHHFVKIGKEKKIII